MSEYVIRDDIDKFYDYGIYVPTSTIYMGSEEANEEDGETGVDSDMSASVIKGLHILDMKSKEITIKMNNIGGDYYHGLAIYDAIRACKNHVTIEVYGHCMSMGALILQAADTRVMSPNSRFMIHYGTEEYSGHTLTFLKWAEESKYLNKQMEDILLRKIRQKRPKFTRAKLRDMLNFDTFFSAEETVDLGLATRVSG